MNTQFEYSYRDADGYATHYCVVLEGSLTKEEIEEICACCDSKEFFIAEQVGLPRRLRDGITKADHAFCSLSCKPGHGFSETGEAATHGTAKDLLNAFRQAKNNWDLIKYDPTFYGW